MNKALIVGSQPEVNMEQNPESPGTTATANPRDVGQEREEEDEEETLVIEPAGWGAWGPWSACPPATDPCSSPPAAQDRTRACRLDGGRGDVVDSIGDCLARGGGDIEVRPCPCQVMPRRKPSPATNATTTTSTTSTTTTTASTPEATTTCDTCTKTQVRVKYNMKAEKTCGRDSTSAIF